jgi:hypothetical protein
LASFDRERAWRVEDFFVVQCIADETVLFLHLTFTCTRPLASASLPATCGNLRLLLASGSFVAVYGALGEGAQQQAAISDAELTFYVFYLK